MNPLRQAWDRLWFSRLDPLSVGAFRISLGVLLLVYYVALWPNWQRYYAADGMISLDAVNPTRAGRPLLSVFTWTEDVVPAGVFWWVGAIAAVSFTLGLRTRFCNFVLFVMQTSLMRTNELTIIGEDSVSRMLLFLGLFAPLGDRLSLDAWLKARREGAKAPADESTWPAVWAVRLMQINIAAVYAFSVPRKLAEGPDWGNGSFIYWAMLNERWSRWPWPQLFYGTRGEVLSFLATFGTLVIEGGFPIFVWFRPLRMYVLGAAAALHLGVALCLQGVTFFQFAMISSFWLFVPPEVTRRWGNALARLFR
jgi:hypothetical protein